MAFKVVADLVCGDRDIDGLCAENSQTQYFLIESNLDEMTLNK